MPDQQKSDITPLAELDEIADSYLDLWQANVKCWATDPDSLEKWVNEAARLIAASHKNTP
ncbi:MAG: hypothetical protein GXP00_04155 [Alphaproteobacteria bacterium]|nr:hypothetical protein [Alphaproteobacteria bacterium]